MGNKPGKKKSCLLSKRIQSITQTHEKKSTPKTLKPLRARQLIRRFHVLLKYKASILTRIAELNNINFEELELNYKSYINGKRNWKTIYDTEWNKTWSELKINKTPDSVIDHKSNDTIDKSMRLEELLRLLGKIDSEIDKRGGLETYQIASTLGQDARRGGDSSKLLVKWLNQINWKYPNCNALEIGCLSSKNEISRSKIFEDIVRIDLHSQEPGVIEEQDFLRRPSPNGDDDKFACISCSLVVNFVPTPEQRGEMMCRMCEFLKEPNGNDYSVLFFVIPLPCVDNSRYCNLELFDLIWKKLGFEKLKYHQSNKLAYWLLKWNGSSKVDMKFTLRKEELRKGTNRNNFCIVIK